MIEPPATQPFELGVVLLAAGASVRMGQPKLLLLWGETSVLAHLLQQWQQLGARQLGVVCARADSRMTHELGRLGLAAASAIVNPNPERGMFSSIQVAAQWEGWSPALTHWAIILGDQPHIPSESLCQLIAFAKIHPGAICQPSRAGRPRHPVLLPKALFQELRYGRQENLREFLTQCAERIALCEIDDPALDLDLDTPADYHTARQTWMK